MTSIRRIITEFRRIVKDAFSTWTRQGHQYLDEETKLHENILENSQKHTVKLGLRFMYSD